MWEQQIKSLLFLSVIWRLTVKSSAMLSHPAAPKIMSRKREQNIKWKLFTWSCIKCGKYSLNGALVNSVEWYSISETHTRSDWYDMWRKEKFTLHLVCALGHYTFFVFCRKLASRGCFSITKIHQHFSLNNYLISPWPLSLNHFLMCTHSNLLSQR